jgi:hypothetical protein
LANGGHRIGQRVTEWGFPALLWRDRIETMKGHDTSIVVRSLHVNSDGVQVLHAVDGCMQLGLAPGAERVRRG